MIPLPEIQIFGGGAHAGRRVDIQDFMVMAPRAKSFAEALEMTAEVYRAAGRDHGRARPPRRASPTKAAGGRLFRRTRKRWIR